MDAVSRMIAAATAYCVARAWQVVAVTTALALATTLFVATHMVISTDTQTLFSPKLPFRQAEIRFDQAFPSASSGIIAVIDAATPDQATLASRKLVTALQAHPELFSRVHDEQDNPYFRQNGLLFLSKAEVADATQRMIQAQPFLAPIARDPSLRGVLSGLSIALDGVAAHQAQLDDLATPIHGLRQALGAAAEGRTSVFDWRALMSGQPETAGARRRLVLIDPKLDFSHLQPGEEASDAVRAIARAQSLDAAHGVLVRLTGESVLADEEFGTLKDHILLIGGLMVAAIVLMLWLATHSVRILLCILASTFVGLSAAAALGLALFDQFNVISVAFIPLFVGLGIDFGIQYAVRFRAEQSSTLDAGVALTAAATGIGGSLALAAAAISAGFLTFLPTRYAGVAQLGAIAGFGLLLAVALSVTFLPALLKLVNPRPPSRAIVSTISFQKIDTFVLTHRRTVLITGAIAGALCIVAMPFLRFDFNPTHLRSVRTESVSTLLSLYADPTQNVSVINVVAPSLDAAQSMAARLTALPEVSSVTTLNTFVPSQQNEKLPLIEDASFLLDATLNPFTQDAPPSDQDIVRALTQVAAKLHGAAVTNPTSRTAPDAKALADVLSRLASGTQNVRARAADSVLPSLLVELDDMRAALTAQPVTRDTLPSDLVRDWLAPDGRARIVVAPKGDQNNNDVLRQFASAVRTIAPDATGSPISTQEAGRAIVEAFLIAGALSFLAVTLILFVALRRPLDVAITMTPIVLTGLLTLGCAAALNEPLNFANVIALPLLIGIGVAFHIYFVMTWRSGEGHLLQSSLARGVLFSALTTATGFGALWLSSHPGTASMGRLLMISLLWTLVSALLFQPALMGPAPKGEPHVK